MGLAFFHICGAKSLEFAHSVLGSLCVYHSDIGDGATKYTLNLKGLS